MIRRRHLHEQEIPQGLQIYEDWIQVAGVGFRKQEAAAFAKSKNLWLELEREPTNKYDENAIKVIGCSRGFFGTKRRHIGYVPEDLAKTIAEGNFTVQPRLKYTYVGESGFVEIEGQKAKSMSLQRRANGVVGHWRVRNEERKGNEP